MSRGSRHSDLTADLARQQRRQRAALVGFHHRSDVVVGGGSEAGWYLGKVVLIDLQQKRW